MRIQAEFILCTLFLIINNPKQDNITVNYNYYGESK